jgi:hypothetical protein
MDQAVNLAGKHVGLRRLGGVFVRNARVVVATAPTSRYHLPLI